MVLQADKWQLVTLVVDCVSGDLEVFLDGSCLHVKGEEDVSECHAGG